MRSNISKRITKRPKARILISTVAGWRFLERQPTARSKCTYGNVVIKKTQCQLHNSRTTNTWPISFCHRLPSQYGQHIVFPFLSRYSPSAAATTKISPPIVPPFFWAAGADVKSRGTQCRSTGNTSGPRSTTFSCSWLIKFHRRIVWSSLKRCENDEFIIVWFKNVNNLKNEMATTYNIGT